VNHVRAFPSIRIPPHLARLEGVARAIALAGIEFVDRVVHPALDVDRGNDFFEVEPLTFCMSRDKSDEGLNRGNDFLPRRLVAVLCASSFAAVLKAHEPKYSDASSALAKELAAAKAPSVCQKKPYVRDYKLRRKHCEAQGTLNTGVALQIAVKGPDSFRINQLARRAGQRVRTHALPI
jgi:hypothetical protein